MINSALQGYGEWNKEKKKLESYNATKSKAQSQYKMSNYAGYIKCQRFLLVTFRTVKSRRALNFPSRARQKDPI